MIHRIVFFDIDGTLLATGGAGQKAMERALAEQFQVDVPFDGVSTAGRTDSGIVAEIFDRCGIPRSERELKRFRDAYLQHLPGYLNALDGSVLPGVAELLRRLAEMDHVVLSLLTGNYARSAWAKLCHFGLDAHFEFGGFGDTHTDRNLVAAEAKAASEAALGCSIAGHQCCVVGDTPADIVCARSIGAVSVAVATGTYTREELEPCSPNFLFETFSDVHASVQAMAEV